MKITFESHKLDSPGYLSCDLPEEIITELEEKIKEVEKNKKEFEDARSLLVGHLSEEYKINGCSKLEKCVFSICKQYDKIFNVEYTAKFSLDRDKKYEFSMPSYWINYQRKNDFNPVHHHSGVFSFVIWVKIPYNLDEELKMYNKSSTPQSSLFSFHYYDFTGQKIRHLLIDKSWEWKMVIFPSCLSHSVNPFYTSDDYRISIAGNVILKECHDD